MLKLENLTAPDRAANALDTRSSRQEHRLKDELAASKGGLYTIPPSAKAPLELEQGEARCLQPPISRTRAPR
jgi:hypothetical protein